MKVRHYLFIFLFALALRLWVLYELRNLDPIPAGTDMLAYYHQALGLLDGTWPPPAPFYLHPLVPLLTAFSFKLLGISTLAPRLLMCFIGAALAPVVAAIGAQLYNPRVGLLAGLLVGAYRASVHDSVVILDTSLTGLVLAGAFLACLSPITRRGIIAGLLLYVGMLGRAILLGPALALVAWLLARREYRPALALVFTLAICLVPIAARNAYYGQPALIGTNGPVNLWIGNHPDARGNFDTCDDPGCPSRPAYEAIRDGDGDWTGHALTYIRSQPLDWLALTARKGLAFLFLPDGILPNNTSVAEYAAHSFILRLLPGYPLFIVLALAGLITMRRRWREFMPLAVVYLPYAAVTTLFFIAARFRSPVVFVFIMVSAVTLLDIARKIPRPLTKKNIHAILGSVRQS